MTAVSHFRGHLFADLRGSTAFTQKAGNAAGAELVKRFRQMVRDEVGQHQGAEVKTEGDAIYVVFPSASMAVMCGLALVDKADRRFEPAELAAVARVYAREAAFRVAHEGHRLVTAADQDGDPEVLAAAMGMTAIDRAQAGLIEDMDAVRDALYR